jgi:hypothetical protein
MRHSTYRIAGHGPLRPPAPATPLLSFPRACTLFPRLFFSLPSFHFFHTALASRLAKKKKERRKQPGERDALCCSLMTIDNFSDPPSRPLFSPRLQSFTCPSRAQ